MADYLRDMIKLLPLLCSKYTHKLKAYLQNFERVFRKIS